MSSFERMIAIPQEEYLALSSLQTVREPLAQRFYDLENRYNSEEKERDPYRRMIMQSNTLDQIKQVKEQMRNSLAVATPKPYQNRAKALFQSVEHYMKFNEKGEIYSPQDGNLIPGSHLEDLIQHAVRDRRRNLTPKGWTDFVTVLRDHNVPKSILNRNTLDEMDEQPTPSPTGMQEVREPLPESQPGTSQGSSTQIRGRKKTKPSRLQPPRQVKPELSQLKPPYKGAEKVKFLQKWK